MGKSKQKKTSQLKRKQMIQEVFKKGKKQQAIAKKFDDKIAQKQGSSIKKNKFQDMKRKKKSSSGNFSREHVAELDKKLDDMRANRKSGKSIL